MICDKTSKLGFPHHWRCIESNGHTGCSCDGTGKWCPAYECRLEDGSRRFPDGSIAAKEHLKHGGVAFGIHHTGTGSFTVVKIPSNK